MYLQSLTLSGFKSFRAKTTVDFDQKVNIIVGPNGSGKSNLIEAIRFAMGENSVKSLRGNNMRDVIFSGSKSEKAVDRAKISLVLNNTDRFLANYEDKVEVSRTLFRDGTSDYQINHHSVRQKDVQNFFSLAGLGKESISFINQGKVQQVIDSDPISRRGIFEEVAGTYKYKLDRREALNNLKEADLEIQRLNDLLVELKKNLKRLAKEKQVAQDYLDKKQLLDRVKIFDLTAKIQQLVVKRKDLSESKLKNEQIYLNLKQALDSGTQKSSDVTSSLEKMQLSQDSLQQDQLNIVKNIEQLNSDHQIAISKKEQIESQLANFKSQITNDQKAIEDLTEQLSDTKNKINDLVALLEKKQLELKELAPQSGLNLNTLNKQLAKVKDDYFSLLQQNTELKNQLNVAKNNLKSNEAILIDYEARLEKSNGSLENKEQEKSAFSSKVKDTYNEFEKLNQQNKDVQEQVIKADNELKQLDEKINKGENQQRFYTSQIADLKQQEAALNGFFTGVQAIIKHAAQIGGIIGTISQLVNVPEQFQEAMSEALGTRFQNIVTKDEVSAKKAIAFLKKSNNGRATFYPVDRIKEQSVPNNLKQQLVNISGFIGLAIDLIEFDNKYRNVISNFFGQLVVAKDLDAATNISHQINGKIRIVTLNGDLINLGGSMTGGKSVKRGDYFRNTRIKERTNDLNKLKDELRSLNTEKLLKIKQQQEFRKNKESVESVISEVVKKLNEQKVLLAGFDSDIDKLKEQVIENRLLIKKQKSLLHDNDEVQPLSNKLIESNHQLQVLEAKVDEINGLIEQKIRDDKSPEVNSLKTEIATLSERQINLQARRRDLDAQIIKLKDGILIKEKSTEQVQQQLVTIREKIQSLDNERSKTQNKAKDIDDKLSSSKIKYQDLKNTNQNLLTEINDLQAKLANSKESINQNDLKIAQLKVKIDNFLDELANEYEMTYEAAENFTKTEKLTDEEKNIKIPNLEKAVKSFGSVNLQSIDDYQKLKERVDFSESQLSDVTEAESELHKSIAQLDQQVRKLFSQTFNKINKSFKETYPEMFNGGSAELKMTDPNDLNKTGIEIIATPPGKKTKSLSLLSGGEKSLSSMALLFSIIKVSTIPWSILDEVEAALDETNTERFSQYLSRFTGRTQFIVITHRKTTMRSAQRLYGVTMAGNGVSQLVTVKLDDNE